MLIGNDHFLRIAIICRTSIENVKLSLPIQHITPDDNSRTTITVSFIDVTGKKMSPDFSPHQLALRIAQGTETTLLSKEDMTPLV
ncbi:hypothetical protein TNCV_3171941 [Trichonephila clavipes]|nr:hypothetical protein TNCV_3171941 [Trichonephila clavipes]